MIENSKYKIKEFILEQHEERFEGSTTVKQVIDFITKKQEEGFLLDISKFDTGIDIDTEGITVFIKRKKEQK